MLVFITKRNSLSSDFPRKSLLGKFSCKIPCCWRRGGCWLSWNECSVKQLTNLGVNGAAPLPEDSFCKVKYARDAGKNHISALASFSFFRVIKSSTTVIFFSTRVLACEGKKPRCPLSYLWCCLLSTSCVGSCSALFRYIAGETERVMQDITSKESYRSQFEAIQHCFKIIGFADKVRAGWQGNKLSLDAIDGCERRCVCV